MIKRKAIAIHSDLLNSSFLCRVLYAAYRKATTIRFVVIGFPEERTNKRNINISENRIKRPNARLK